MLCREGHGGHHRRDPLKVWESRRRRAQFRMGRTEGEMQGWQFLGQGIAQALRNADAHRIEERPDHKRYALGLVGACSLLLTQMRFEHGNRFRDTTPAVTTDPDA